MISAKAMEEFVAELEASGADPQVVALAKQNLAEMRNRDEKLKAKLQVRTALKLGLLYHYI